MIFPKYRHLAIGNNTGELEARTPDLSKGCLCWKSRMEIFLADFRRRRIVKRFTFASSRHFEIRVTDILFLGGIGFEFLNKIGRQQPLGNWYILSLRRY
jgi:hypothetical protein